MKIIEHTSTTLIIKDISGRIWFAGLCILVIAGVTFAGFIESFTSDQNKVNEYGASLIFLFSLVGLAIGGSILYDHPFIYAKFRKDRDEASVHRTGILKNERISYRLSDIEDIIVTESGNTGCIFYGVAAKIKNNGSIPLSAMSWEINNVRNKNLEVIKKFLGKD